MKRQIARLTPFCFESDFSAPVASEGPEVPVGDIVLTADELSAILADTRQSTAEFVRDTTLKAHADQMQTLSKDMKSALGLVVELAGQLQTAALDEHDRRAALEKVRRLASTLVAGQTDLFKKS